MLEINLIAVLTQSIAFILLALGLRKVAFGPLSQVIDGRRKEVQDTLDQIAADRKAMEASRAEYEQRLAGIEAEAREHITTAVKHAQEEAALILTKARDESTELRNRALAEIDLERRKALVEIRAQVADLVVLAAGKVLERELSPATHRDLVRDFIQEVGRTS